MGKGGYLRRHRLSFLGVSSSWGSVSLSWSLQSRNQSPSWGRGSIIGIFMLLAGTSRVPAADVLLSVLLSGGVGCPLGGSNCYLACPVLPSP